MSGQYSQHISPIIGHLFPLHEETDLEHRSGGRALLPSKVLSVEFRVVILKQRLYLQTGSVQVPHHK